jgi:hypothetical protein
MVQDNAQNDTLCQIATGFALATTFLVGLPRLLAVTPQRTGMSLRSWQWLLQ